MIIVQISDTHIDEPGTLVYGRFDTTSALEYRAGFTAGLGRELQEDDLLSIATHPDYK